MMPGHLLDNELERPDEPIEILLGIGRVPTFRPQLVDDPALALNKNFGLADGEFLFGKAMHRRLRYYRETAPDAQGELIILRPGGSDLDQLRRGRRPPEGL